MGSEKKERIKELITAYYKHYKKMPNKKWIKEKVKYINDKKILALYRELAEENFLLLNNTRYVYNPDYPHKPKAKQVQEPTEKRMPVSILILIIITIIIGISCIAMSTYFTYQYATTLFSNFWAFVLSSSMICFSVASFELIVLFWQRNNKPLAVIFSLCWLITVSFSMNSTVEVLSKKQINNNIETVQENKEKITNKSLYDLYSTKRNETLADKKRLEQDIETYQTIIGQYDKDSQKEADSAYYVNYRHKQRAEESLAITENTLKEIDTNIETLLKSGVVQDIEIIETIEAAPDMVLNRLLNFLMKIFPAIFIDIMAPLSIAVALFLRKE